MELPPSELREDLIKVFSEEMEEIRVADEVMEYAFPTDPENLSIRIYDYYADDAKNGYSWALSEEELGILKSHLRQEGKWPKNREKPVPQISTDGTEGSRLVEQKKAAELQ